MGGASRKTSRRYTFSVLLAVVLAQIRAGWLARAAIGAALGTFAWLSIDVSYWNWYGFPGMYVAGTFIDQAVGWLLGAAAIGLVLGRPRATVVPASALIA